MHEQIHAVHKPHCTQGRELQNSIKESLGQVVAMHHSNMQARVRWGDSRVICDTINLVLTEEQKQAWAE